MADLMFLAVAQLNQVWGCRVVATNELEYIKVYFILHTQTEVMDP